MSRDLAVAVLNHARDVVILTDLERRIVWVNPAFTTLTGYSFEEVLGRRPGDFLQGDGTDPVTVARIRASLSAGEDVSTTILNYTKSGRPYWLDLAISVMHDASGRPSHYMAIERDITEAVIAREAIRANDARWTSLNAAFPGVIFEWVRQLDGTGGFTYVSERADEVLGVSAESLKQDWSAFNIHKQDLPRWRAGMEEAIAKGLPWRFEGRRIRPDGRVQWWRVLSSPITRDDGSVSFQGVISDVTDEVALRRRTDAILNSLTDGIGECDGRGQITMVNPALCAMLGFSPEELVGQRIDRLMPAAIALGHDTHIQRFLRDRVSRVLGMSREVRAAHKDGTEIPVYIAANLVTPVEDESAEIAHDPAQLRFVASLKDIRAEHASKAEIERLAFTDAETGLPNINAFERALTEELDALKSGAGGHSVVLSVGLKDFGAINVTYGRDTANALMAMVGTRLGRSFPRVVEVCRYTGAAFLVLLREPDVVDLPGYEATLRDVFSSAFSVLGSALHLDWMAAGIVLLDQASDVEDALKDIGVAMDRARGGTAGRLAVFSVTEVQAVVDRRIMVEQLRAALIEDRLTAWYQPKVKLEDGRICGFEALVRWPKADGGFVPPDLFIPLAEDIEMTAAIDQMMLRRLIGRDHAILAEAGHNVPVALNVSARDLVHGNLLNRFDLALQESGFDPSLLEVEVTEHALLRDMAEAVKVLAGLRERGMSVAIDDFGVGHSSLAYLRHLPIDRLKIDRSFLAEATQEPRAAAILRSMIDLGQNLGLSVLVEGVESEQDAALLRGMGCQEAQGWAFGRPAPPESYTKP